MVDDALLDFRDGIASGNGLGEAAKIVHTGDENVLHAPVFQLV
jgi:hypothetical protein